jgi:phosphatidylserine decarboxylase
MTAVAAMLYRDPERTTPDDPGKLYAAADGLVLALDEQYEHRYLHTDATRIITLLSPFDVPVSRSPVGGVVEYCEHVPGDYRGLHHPDAAETNSRTYIGLNTTWGHILVVQVAGPLARKITCRVKAGDYVDAGARIGTARFGSRIDILVPRDAIRPLVQPGQRMTAGETRLAAINA